MTDTPFSLLMMTFFALGAVMLGAANAPAQTALVRDGDPRASIVIAEDAPDTVQTAAKELRTHIQKISGAELPSGHEPAGDMPVTIYIGGASPEPGTAKIKEGGTNPAAFRVRVTDDAVHLTGLSGEGALHATYDMLEQLGVRWFMPGEIGTVIPDQQTVAIQTQDTIEHPGFEGRHLQAVAAPTWERRMRFGGIDSGGHGLGPRFDREENPELFMHVDGEPTHQENVGKQEVIDRTVEYWLKRLDNNPDMRYMRIGPHDGTGFGNHPWDAGDMDPLHGKVSVTDRYIKFFNQVLDRVQEKHPDAGIGFYAYSQYMRPPVREKPNPNILPMLAPIDACRLHTMQTPHCWERQYISEIIAGWQDTGVNMMYRGYLFNLANPGVPYSMTKRTAIEYRYFYEHGIIGCRVETMPAWAWHGPTLYLAAKMMWDPMLDVDALLEDYYGKFYGPAAEPMQRYFNTLEDAYLDADYHTGHVFDVVKIMTDEVRANLDQALSEAESAVPGDSTYAERVAMARTGYRCGELVLDTINAFNRCDFDTAKQKADDVRALMEKGMAHDPPLIDHSVGQGYFDRFWGHNVDAGYAATHGENEFVLQLPDEWRFMLDPYQGGEQLGLWKPSLGNKPWRTIRTYSQSWSNQGLRYYKGDAWYRTTFDVPAEYEGKQLTLWFSGVDNNLTVWINGTEIEMTKKGASPIGRPWEFDATDAIKFDGENVIAIRVNNDRLREIGTGGLTGPAMIYASPAE